MNPTRFSAATARVVGAREVIVETRTGDRKASVQSSIERCVLSNLNKENVTNSSVQTQDGLTEVRKGGRGRGGARPGRKIENDSPRYPLLTWAMHIVR